MKKAVLAMLVPLMALLCACTGIASADFGAPHKDAKTEVVQSAAQDAALAQVGLEISRAAHEYSEDILMYPQVAGDAAEAINKSLFNELTESIDGINTPVYTSYRIENNGCGLFSVLIYVYDIKSGEQLKLIPLTYDMQSGQKLAISDLFAEQNDRWRRVLPDIVTEQANERAIPLLCEVMPISDDQEYYIAGSSLVLVYKLYEISTYSAGRPEFPIPISELAEFLPEDGKLLPLAAQDCADETAQVPAEGPMEEPMDELASATDEASEEPVTEEAPIADETDTDEAQEQSGETDAPVAALDTVTPDETAAEETENAGEQTENAEGDN